MQINGHFKIEHLYSDQSEPEIKTMNQKVQFEFWQGVMNNVIMVLYLNSRFQMQDYPHCRSRVTASVHRLSAAATAQQEQPLSSPAAAMTKSPAGTHISYPPSATT